MDKVIAFFRGMTLGGIRSIFRKELIQLKRDPFLMAFIITLPIIQLVVTGMAVSKDLKHVPMVVCNYDHNNASIELLKSFHQSTFFDIDDRNYVNSEDEVVSALRQGRFRVGMIIPPNYSRALMGSGIGGVEKADIHLLVDGTNATVAKTVVSAAEAIVSEHTRSVMNTMVLNDDDTQGLPIDLQLKTLYNEDLKSSYFLIPGILAIIMHMMTILFTSFAIVRERETGTLEQLMVTPIRVSDLMVGKVIPYAVIGLLDMILTLAVMVWFFSIDISGNFLFLGVASTIFIITSLAIGLLISTTCRSQVQAVQVTMGLLLPSLLLSGFVFPLEPMPWFIKIVSYSLPLTYYLDIIRGVVIKGTGLAELWVHTLILIFLSSILLSASITRFKKQVA